VVIRPGERYVISGIQSNAMLPPPSLAHMGTADNITEYVEVFRSDLPEAVASDLEWLSRNSKDAILTGSLRMQNFGDGVSSSWATAFRGTRILVSSGARQFETVIAGNGRFELTGLPPGRAHIRALLPEDLTITIGSTTTVDLTEGGCKEVHLAANLNGRVRGHIFTAAPFESVKISLEGGMSPTTLANMQPGLFYSGASHAPRVQTTLKENGTFELYGVPPGWYVLSAWVEPAKDGPRRSTAYYPGTPHLSYATPIEVGRATVHEGFDFSLPE
jgi:hypothetical protein